MDFVKNRAELKVLLDKQEELITKYLINFYKRNFDEQFCYKFYNDLDIPYAIIYASLNYIKKEIIKELSKNEINKEEVIEFGFYFDKFINLVAKVYLKKEIQTLNKIKSSKFKNFILYKSIVDYVDKIIESISKDDASKFPLISSKDCKFIQYLYYPESLMVCIDKNLCGYLEEMHTIIHKSVNSFYMFYIKGAYSEAYFLFKDFKELILKFFGVISELYFVTYSDVEKSFFKLATLLQPDGDMYLTMIDFKNLKGINSIYGELAVTEALNIIENILKEYFAKDMSRSLIIRGVTANFYILNIKCSDKEYQKVINDIYEIVNIKLQKEIKISLQALIVGMKIEKFSNYKDYDFLKMFNILKNNSKKERVDIKLVISKEEKEKLKKKFFEKYTRKFLKEKLDNGDVDVVFQPIYEVENKEMYAIEALGRIIDGTKFISSGIFIDDIYEMRMIDEFDILIIKRILQKKDFIKQVTNRIFINVSFNSLLNEEYKKLLSKLIKEFNDVEIILELTEQKFIENLNLVEEIHNNLKVLFAIDDFGSGYSSLKTVVEKVKRKILKILKIEGSLILNMQNDEYLRKIIKVISILGKEFMILTVAEFVENKLVLEYLKEMKVNLAQGYYLSAPKTIEELLIEKMEKFHF